MTATEVQIIIGIGTVLLSAASAWGGSNKALNGTKERVNRIEKHLDDDIRGNRIENKLDKVIDDMGSIKQRVSMIEGMCPLCGKRVNK